MRFVGLIGLAAVGLTPVNFIHLYAMSLAVMSLIDLPSVGLQVWLRVWHQVCELLMVPQDYIINVATLVSQSKVFPRTVHSFIQLEICSFGSYFDVTLCLNTEFQKYFTANKV